MEKNKNDDGVSPIIGVVLMVALVVILSGLVFTNVISFGQGVGDKPPEANFGYDLIISPPPGESPSDYPRIKITLESVERLDSATVVVNGNEVTGNQFLGPNDNPKIGESYTLVDGSKPFKDDSTYTISEGDRIVVVGEYNTRRSVISTYVVST